MPLPAASSIVSLALPDQLFVELLSDEKKTAAFINGILPKELMEEVAKQNKDANRPTLLNETN